MLKGSRPITEKTARRIEEGLQLPSGWLDRDWPSPGHVSHDLRWRQIPQLTRRYFTDPKVRSQMTFPDYMAQFVVAGEPPPMHEGQVEPGMEPPSIPHRSPCRLTFRKPSIHSRYSSPRFSRSH